MSYGYLWQTPNLLFVSLVILGLIILSGFFALFGFAFEHSQKLRLQVEENELGRKNRAKKRLLNALENPRLFFLTGRLWTVVPRTLAAVFGGYYTALWFYDNAGSYAQISAANGAIIPIGVAICTVAVALALLIIADAIPRLIARNNPEEIAAALLPIISVLAFPLRPFNYLALRITAPLREALHLKEQQQGITEDELRIALIEGEKSGVVESKERTMVEGVFYLGDRPAGAFMTHRSEIQWIDVNDSPEEVYAKALEHREQHCFPVADGTLDAIIGAAYLEDIVIDHASQQGKGLRVIMKKPLFIPQSLPAIKAFESFRRAEANYIFAMDEYGGFAGIVSLSNLVEEIVGELTASDTEENALAEQADGTWIADGSLNIDDVVEKISLQIPEAEHSDYHTLAGFILSLAEELPRIGDSFVHGDFRFTVTAMDGNRIDKIRIAEAKSE